MKKISIILSLLVAGFAATSCFDMEEHPFTLLDAGNYFTDETSVKQVIANIYAQVYSSSRFQDNYGNGGG